MEGTTEPMTAVGQRIPFAADTLTHDAPFAEAVARLLGSSTGDRVVLDFADLTLSTAQRLRPFHLLVLANVVMTARQDLQLGIAFPRTDTARLAVLRSGLLFGLAGRQNPIRTADIEGLSAAPEQVDKWLDLWRMPWSPGQAVLGQLFDDQPRPVDDPTVLDNTANAKKATRIVVDPHLESRDSLMEQASRGIAGAWLQCVTPSSSDDSLRRRRLRWQSLVTSRVLGEPLINLPDHALTRPLGSQTLEHPIHSLVLLARTDGGGTESAPRLQLVVSDNGYGLVRTLRPKLQRSDSAAPERAHAEDKAEDLLAWALSRPARTVQDPGLPWARDTFGTAVQHADGLDEAAAASRAGYFVDVEFTIITGDPDASNETVWASVPYTGQADHVRCGRIHGVPFNGTTVFAHLPIPHSPLVTRSNMQSESHSSASA